MITLFKHSTHSLNQVHFHIYPHVVASHTMLKNTKEIMDALPEGSVLKQERENPHLGDIFIEGIFSNKEEIRKFVKGLLFGKD